MQDAGYGNLQGKVGFVYGSFSVVAAIWVVFMIPEMKGRALEELDEMFEKNVSVFRFGTFKTEGFGAQLAEAEQIAASKDYKLAKVIDGVDTGELALEYTRNSEKGAAKSDSAEV